jgi:hypothetical protein
MKKVYNLFFSAIISISLFAQAPQTWTSADIYLAIKKLNVLGQFCM